MIHGISKSEFARREGVSRALVDRKLKSGALKALPDGTLDPALVGSGWHAGKRDVAAKAEATTTAAGKIPPKHESEAAKEFYLSQLRRLEFEEKQGKLLPADEVTKAVTWAYLRVRSKMIAIPNRAAPLVAGATTEAAADVLQRLVHEALDELAGTRIRDWVPPPELLDWVPGKQRAA